MPSDEASKHLVAVDVGNSRVKLGLFVRNSECLDDAQEGLFPIASPRVQEPLCELALPLDLQSEFSVSALEDWTAEYVGQSADWIVSSVQRGATGQLRQWAEQQPRKTVREFVELTYKDMAFEMNVLRPQQVGMDRLVGALAAKSLKPAQTPAIIVDHGTAITVDLLDTEERYCGGATLPGIAMSAKALAAGTDALPVVSIGHGDAMPAPIGKDTESSIAAGLAWGTLGAVAELLRQIAASLEVPPVVFVTGGAALQLAEHLQRAFDFPIVHKPYLVLSGIALAGRDRITK